MITLHDALFALDPTIRIIRGDVAYDKDDKEVAYDATAAQAKLIELQVAETAAQQAQETAKASALSKLTALGLTQDEINALLGAN